MSGAYPTDAAWEWLRSLSDARTLWAYQCPAIKPEAAIKWGTEMAAKLRDEIRDGTFDQLDGEVCRIVVPEWRPVAVPVHRQGVLL